MVFYLGTKSDSAPAKSGRDFFAKAVFRGLPIFLFNGKFRAMILLLT
jgi:hypothetical protein